MPTTPRPDPGAYSRATERLDDSTAAPATGQRNLQTVIPSADDVQPTLLVSAVGGPPVERRREPVTVGIPLPRSWLREAERLAVVTDTGRPVALQTRALDRWGDGSIRWVLVDFQADVQAGAVRAYKLLRLGQSPAPAPLLRAVVADGHASVDTGLVRFTLSHDGRIRCEGGATVAETSIGVGLDLRDAQGNAVPIRIERIVAEEQGPLRSTVFVEGTAGHDRGLALLRISARHHFYAGTALVRTALTLHNPRRARHRGGCWDLGDPGSVYVRDASFTLHLPGQEEWEPFCSCEPGELEESYSTPFELYQDSSGGENWRSFNHVNRRREVPVVFCGYRLSSPAGERYGRRATPIVGLRQGNRQVSLAHRHFWQRFPKAFEATARSLALRVLPGQWADVHEIQGGEQITEEFVVSFARDVITNTPLDWVRSPLRARMEPSWYCASEAMPYLTPASDDPNRSYLALVNAAVDGEDTFEAKRERIDEYGWRHFGDLYGDHEAVHHQGPRPLISHYNNQYDAIAGLACQAFRGGDLRWLSLMDDLARHVMDSDIYRTFEDKAGYNGGLFWHTHHYTDADLATHRTYPRASGTAGGGPAAEHNYNTGLMLYHFLSGDQRAKEAAVDLGRWVVDMDDGSKSPLRWLSRRPTGLASATGSRRYHGPGRGPGNSIVVLLNAFRLSGDRRYVAKVEELIGRCVHPADDLPARNLLDAERRWYYTVFLQAIGLYLDVKAERDELDERYAYARASLLHYSRWMAAHEYPYLDTPEILEHPTETWAAQDMRKSEVFKYAATHASAEERAVFLERSRFFFDYSVTTLSAMVTRTLVRPVVILLLNGYRHAFFERTPGHAAPAPRHVPFSFGRPSAFVPQRTAAVRLLAAIGILVSVLLLAALMVTMG